MRILLLGLFALSSGLSYASCENLIQDKIVSIEAKIKGLSLAKYLAIGATAGGVGGMALSYKQNHNRNSYLEGYNAGATPSGQSASYNAGFQSGYSGQSGADYLEGYQVGNSGQSNVPQKPNYLANAAVGVGSGAAVGGSVFLAKKMILKRSLKKYKTIHDVFASSMSDEAVEKSARILMPFGKKNEWARLSPILSTFQDTYCSTPGYKLSIRKLKRFVKKHLKH